MAYHKGKFKPKFPEKYRGDPTNIVFRSGWEFKVMRQLDENKAILEWSSEEVVIPYISPLDGKPHKYYVDFLVKVKDRDGKIVTHLWEVKPLAQTKPPVVKNRNSKPTKKYITEVARFGVNDAKWRAAQEYCKDHGWKFSILTETHLFPNK